LHGCPNESFKGLFAKVCLNDAYSGWYLLGSSLVVFGTILAYSFCCISAPDDKVDVIKLQVFQTCSDDKKYET